METKLSQQEHDSVFAVIRSIFLAGAVSSSTPRLFIIAGQPGCGKTALIDDTLKTNPSCVVINGDEYRAYHPQHEQIIKQYDKNAAQYTDPDVRIWTQRLFSEALHNKFNIIFEGTLRTDAICDTIANAQSLGYTIHLKIRALNELESRLNIYKRYEEQLNAGIGARFTTMEAHDSAYKASPTVLFKIENHDLFDTIEIYNSEKCVYSVTKNDRHTKAAETLDSLRKQPFNSDKIASYLKTVDKIIASMTARGEEAQYINDVKSLQTQVKEKTTLPL